MKQNLPPLARSYRTALRKHLQNDAVTGLSSARALGERALRAGLQTLDLAKIHESALLSVVLPNHSPRGGKVMIRRCVAFFAEAAAPMEKTQGGTRETSRHWKELLEALTERTMELAKSNTLLKQEISRRHQVEDSLRVSELTSSKLLEKSLQMQEELRQLSRRLLSAQEEERLRISRDLHDVIAQTLTGINLRLAALKSQAKASTRDLHQKIGATQRMVEKSVTIVHRFARDLRPAMLDHLGLIPALKNYIKDFMANSSTRVSLVIQSELEKLPCAILTVLYRVVQEALTNVDRHAQASRVTLRFHEETGESCLQIRDNGKGFKIADANLDRSGIHLGLLGIRERVEMVGGRFTVQSTPGRGTTLQIRIPTTGANPAKTAVNPPLPTAVKTATARPDRSARKQIP